MSHTRWKVHAARLRSPRTATRAVVAAVIALGATLPLGRWAALGGVVSALLLSTIALLLRRGRALPTGEWSVRERQLQPDAATEEYSLPADEVTEAWVVPGLERATVELDRRDGARLSLTADDAAAAGELLGAMGFDAQRRSIRVRLGRPWDGPLRALGALLFGGLQTLPLLALFAAWLQLGPVARAILFASAAVAGFYAASRTMGPPELTIGADGITLQRGFRPRFLPFRLLRWIERDGDDLVLLLNDEQRVRISPTSRDAARDDMVIERVRRAAERARAPSESPAVALLDRNGRSLDDWREGLGALRSHGGYRGVGLSAPELERVIVDPGASAERRVGAAMALAAQDPDRARARVRVSVETCADPEVRAAVEAALRGALDDEALERAADEARDVAELRRGIGV